MSYQAVWNVVTARDRQILSKTNQHYWTRTSCFPVWNIWWGISQSGMTNRNAPLITKKRKHRETIREHEEFMIIWKSQSNDLPAAGTNKMGFLLPLPLHFQPLCLKAPCCPPAQAPHTDKYVSSTSPSLSTLTFYSLASVGSTFLDPDGHLGRVLLSLCRGLWS